MQPVLPQQPTSAAASAQQQPGTMMFSAKQAPFTLAAAVTMALQPIFLTLSKGPKGYFEYSVGSATLLCELLKLGFSSISLAIQLARNPELKSSVLSNRPWLEFAQFFLHRVSRGRISGVRRGRHDWVVFLLLSIRHVLFFAEEETGN